MAAGSRREKKRGRGRRGQAGFWPYVVALGGAAVVAAVCIVVVLLSAGGSGDGGGGAGRPVILPSPIPTGIAQEGHLLGSAGAPVTLIEYADFQ